MDQPYSAEPGIRYWSFASYIKLKAKSAVKYVTDYEEAMIQFSRKSGMDGVICGTSTARKSDPSGISST